MRMHAEAHALPGARRLRGQRQCWLAVRSCLRLAGSCIAGFSAWSGAGAQHPPKVAVNKAAQCRRAVLEGTVRAGQGFQVQFARGLVFGLEPIPSGWALRVVAANKPREAHDYAELATLPYQSVSSLLLSTDWSFRAQDAVGWTPRRFHYAASDAAFGTLAAGYAAVLRGEGPVSARMAVLADEQPEGVLQIEDATLAPGVADQVPTASAVSKRFSDTPHRVDSSAPATSLGRLEEVRFRVSLDLPEGLVATEGVRIDRFACVGRPTAGASPASHERSKPKGF